MKKDMKDKFAEYNTCENCVHSREIGNDILMCSYKGPVKYDGCCRKFEIDLLSLKFRKLRNPSFNVSEEDFIL